MAEGYTAVAGMARRRRTAGVGDQIMCTRKLWEPEKSADGSLKVKGGLACRGKTGGGSLVGRMTDRGVVPRMATKATS